MTGTLPALDRLLALLPVHVVARDEETGGLLRALLSAVGGELDLLERDIEELYSSWFVETCPEWVVPYIADLVGVTDLPPDLAGVGGAGVSRRAFVANTVAYRRRKGTAAVIEQVARDVTGWPASVVEYHRHLAAATHVNHVRLDRPTTAMLRTQVSEGGPLDLVPIAVAQGALDPLAHTADVRHIARLRGRYGISNLGVYLFPDQVYAPFTELEDGVGGTARGVITDELWSPARPPDGALGGGWSVYPLGLDGPIYAVPETEESIEHLATESDLPVPMRPRRLLALLRAARLQDATEGRLDQLALPIAVRVNGGNPLSPNRIRVSRLEDIAVDESDPAQPQPLDGWQVVVNAITGRLHPYFKGVQMAPARLETRFGYGATADVGAGTYDRSAVHTDVLAADPYVGDPDRGGPRVNAQVLVLSEASMTTSPLATALADAENAWDGPDSPAGATYVIAIGDNGRYPGAHTVHVPQDTRLVVVAAAWRPRVFGPAEILPPVPGVYAPEGVRPHIKGTLTITGDSGSSVVLDGLTIEGDVVVDAGALGSLAVSQCTVTGTVAVGVGSSATNLGVRVQVVRSVLRGVRIGPAAATVEVRDTMVDGERLAAESAAGSGPAGAVTGDGVSLTVSGSTLCGAVRVRTLVSSSAILDGPVTVEHRQAGCVRFSFVPPTARVPRRYRCAPGPDDDPQLRPVYASVDPGSPHYLTLAAGCARAIAEGGEDGSEMGAHHHLRRPVRLRAAARLLGPYVPVGLEIGVTAPAATAGS